MQLRERECEWGGGVQTTQCLCVAVVFATRCCVGGQGYRKEDALRKESERLSCGSLHISVNHFHCESTRFSDLDTEGLKRMGSVCGYDRTRGKLIGGASYRYTHSWHEPNTLPNLPQVGSVYIKSALHLGLSLSFITGHSSPPANWRQNLAQASFRESGYTSYTARNPLLGLGKRQTERVEERDRERER